MTDRQYVYKITEIVKVTDGDTYWVRCDVGFRQEILINVRLADYDCPEAHKGTLYEKTKAKEAREVAETWLLSESRQLWIRTEKDPDNFGRWLGHIWDEWPDGTIHALGGYLRRVGLASLWPTRWRDEFNKGAESSL